MKPLEFIIPFVVERFPNGWVGQTSMNDPKIRWVGWYVYGNLTLGTNERNVVFRFDGWDHGVWNECTPSY